IMKNHNPYHENHRNRFAWLRENLASDADVLYFVGCTSSYRQQKIAQATVNVLKASKTSFMVLGSDEWCCGSPLLRTGQFDLVKDLARHNVSAIEKLGVKTVIFSCAGCYKTFKEDYPKLGLYLPFRIRHTTQYFLELMREKKIKVKKLPIDVTYHDPCHLGRHTRVYKQPRKILHQLQMSLREMPRSMEEAFCCGAGSGVRSAYPEFSHWVCKERLTEAQEVGVSTLASACPFCKNNFEETMQELPDLNLRIADISELIEEGLED
ncbi:MAG: (Fe-S)-binding protein, partial [Candidatus Helarchaeota archaeon]